MAGQTTVLITGGSRSGKSSYALKLAHPYQKKGFIATAEALDDEMKERIINHQRERAESFVTIEEPLQIAEVIGKRGDEFDLLILDCLTVWLGNLHFHLKSPQKYHPLIQEFLEVLKNPPCDLILVSNEIGMGIIPENKLSRKFRDDAGKLNQQVAELAGRVILMVSGIPVVIKGNSQEASP